MISFGQWIAGEMNYATLPLFLDDHRAMGSNRLLPQQELSTMFKERFAIARRNFEQAHQALAAQRFFRKVTPTYAYSQLTLLRKLWAQCRDGHPETLNDLGWEYDNEVNAFRIWVQNEHWRIFHVTGPDTWDQLNDLVEFYFGRNRRIVPLNPQVMQQVNQRRRNVRGGGNVRQLPLAAGRQGAQEEPVDETPVPPPEQQAELLVLENEGEGAPENPDEGAPENPDEEAPENPDHVAHDEPQEASPAALVPGQEEQLLLGAGREADEVNPGENAVVTWRDYLLPTFWVQNKKQRVTRN
jgi:hypothetical protein